MTVQLASHWGHVPRAASKSLQQLPTSQVRAAAAKTPVDTEPAAPPGGLRASCCAAASSATTAPACAATAAGRKRRPSGNLNCEQVIRRLLRRRQQLRDRVGACRHCSRLQQTNFRVVSERWAYQLLHSRQRRRNCAGTRRAQRNTSRDGHIISLRQACLAAHASCCAAASSAATAPARNVTVADQEYRLRNLSTFPIKVWPLDCIAASRAAPVRARAAAAAHRDREQHTDAWRMSMSGVMWIKA